MNVSIHQLTSLSASDRAAWNTFRSEDLQLASPYFSLAFLEAVDAVRPGLEVLRFSVGEEAVGFLPIRKGWLGTARPPAGPMDDLHGVIARADTVIDLTAPEVGRCLAGYAFSSVPYTQRRHGLDGQFSEGNQIMDLASGFGAYIDARSEVSSNFRRAWRKVSRLLDDPRIDVAHQITDSESFERLIELKRDAFAAAGFYDLFKLAWPQRLLEQLAASKDTGAQGVLSKLCIDGELAAVCFCMRSETVLHYWFPAYEAKFQTHKAGLALLFSLAEWGAAVGIQEMHLGLGDSQYKRLMASYRMPVRQGTLAIRGVQKLNTSLSNWSSAIETRGGVRALPAKLARKYERIALTGKVSA